MGTFSFTPDGSVIILGVISDKCINMYEHVTSVCRAAYYHLKNIHCLRKFLTQEALVTIVHIFVTSRIAYFNSLLYGISDYMINRLQRIQNSAFSLESHVENSGHPFRNICITSIIRQTRKCCQIVPTYSVMQGTLTFCQ